MLLGATGILFLVAGVVYTVMSGAESIPDTDDTKTAWYCTECDKGYELAASQLKGMVTNQPESQADDGEDEEGCGRARAHGHGPGKMIRIAKCPDCSGWTGVAAAKCESCLFQLTIKPRTLLF